MSSTNTDRSELWDKRKFDIYVSCVIISLTIATAALLLRVWVRLRVIRKSGADDWILVSAHITNIVACTVWLYLRRLAMGVEDNSEESYEVLSNVSHSSIQATRLQKFIQRLDLHRSYQARASRTQRLGELRSTSHSCQNDDLILRSGSFSFLERIPQ